MIGKGLESLIPRKDEQPSNEKNKKETIFWVETKLVVPNPYQPRRDFEQSALDVLAESIKRYGILQPIIVTKNEKKDSQGMVPEYQIVAGERRLRAAKMIGMDQVPVIIKEQTEKEKLEISLIENVHRSDLNPVEKAETYQRFLKEFGLRHQEIADLVGTSRVAISNTVRLLTLPENVRKAIKLGKLSEGHSRAILMVKTPGRQEKLADECVRNNYSVRQAERRAQEIMKALDNKEKRSAFKYPKAVIKELQNKVENIFGIDNFFVKEKESRLKVVFTFRTKKELEEWLGTVEKK
ncbi:MAG: ParB/RepB/Spo0J family partition protein [Candidatus Paceibacterota bacterium]|jgi:ParB family chromosome partitioning protein|nr:ParB/RepB/Spo0J family partition protein [Candidatus Paceibacterota bacterium]